MTSDFPGQALKNEIARRIEDLAAEDPLMVATMLALNSIEILSTNFPAKLDASAKALVKDNYPDASDRLINQRSLNEQGLQYALGIAANMARIVVDYSPLSNVKNETVQDFSLDRKAENQIHERIADTYAQNCLNGYTAFGSAASMILMATKMALSAKVSPIKLMRPLLDAMELTLKEASEGSDSYKEMEEAAVRAVADQLGISIQQARKYLKEFKQNH